MSVEDLQRYESEVELDLYRQYREVVGMFRHVVETERRWSWARPRRRNWRRMLATQERLIVLLPESWSEYRDRGLAHAELGNTEQALADLECYLVHADERVDLNAIADRVDDLRRS